MTNLTNMTIKHQLLIYLMIFAINRPSHLLILLNTPIQISQIAIFQMKIAKFAKIRKPNAIKNSLKKLAMFTNFIMKFLDYSIMI